MEELINHYIKLLEEKGDNDEVFKWKAIDHFQKHWDIAAADFYKMFKEAFRLRENLLFQNSWGFIDKAARHFPGKVREMFINLYDKKIDLSQRIVNFQESSRELLPKVKEATKKEKLNDQQDERTLSVYLSFRYPDNYFIYMASFFGNYCKLINISEPGTNKNYILYLKLAEDFKKRFVEDNAELQKLHQKIYPVTKWDSNNLITQNIFYLLLKNKADMEKFLTGQTESSIVLVNITWNSNDWKSPSDDASNHRWVKEGNIPHESWNFDLENSRNKEDEIFGYAQFTHPPSLKGDNNLIIFHSKGRIVGFYGKAEILHTPVVITEAMSYNLIGNKDLSLVLKNKIENIKEKGYLEDKQRMGQIGFIYLKHKETVLHIIEEALKLNPEESKKLNNLKAWLNSYDASKTDINHPEKEKIETPKLNQILFGPPGTGKTYKTINKALEIIRGKEFVQNNAENRNILVSEFNRLKDSGQIEFITFHQSFSYEDFVEGIKPILNIEAEDDLGKLGDIQYEIREGIFKRICSRAKGVSSGSREKHNKIDFDNASYYKMSIGGIHKPHIHDWCIKNNKLALGWGGEVDHSQMIEYLGNWNNFRNHYRQMFPDLVAESKYHIQAMYLFLVMKKGDVVMVSKGNKIIDAIGFIKSDKYIFDDTQDFGYCQFREVEWLATDMNATPELFVKKNIMMQSIYQFYPVDIKKEYFKREFSGSPEVSEKEKYVLIIDEINRGNVASIFGELITLIEEDKRIGAENQLLVRLPYSGIDGENFGVPDNLYLVGTMNTADRSIEALDTALRRRFSFEELSPVPALILGQGSSLAPGGMVDDVDVVKLLQTMNDRIEKLIDKDHKIGHSYFMKIEKTKEGLKQVFYDKIIPLLEEYFFGDFGKIGLVLGSSFVEKVNNTNGFDFADFPEYGDTRTDLTQREIYRIKPPEAWDFVSIYTKKQK
jgi:hypothetical protein